MNTQQLRELILRELPALIQNDSAFREAVLLISRTQFADKTETSSRFDHMMARLDRLMEADRKKWKEYHKEHLAILSALQSLEQRTNKKIEEDARKWEEIQKRFEEQERQSAALTLTIQKLEQRINKKIEEDRKKWEENQQQWQDNQKRWEKFEQKNEQQWQDNQKCWEKHDQQMVEVNQTLNRFDQRLMAMGARWGTQSEASFRNALKGILKEFPGVQVIQVDEHDDEGIVFGYPEEVELDLIIKNGVLIIGEIKSSIDKSDISTFERKIRFYQQKHAKTANRKIVISPMVNKKALPLATKFGIEIYSFVEEVEL